MVPVDGLCVESGLVQDGLLIQAKGLSYSIKGLFNDSSLADYFKNASAYWTFYLAPVDYHRIHSPAS